MRKIILASVGLLALASAHAAFADDKGPTVSSPTPYQHCGQGDAPLFDDFPPKNEADTSNYLHYTILNNDGVRDLLAWGTIDQCDEGRLKRALKAARPFNQMIIFSGGGALEEAFAMGHTIRDSGVSTLIKQGTMCASACNFLFMGGVIREIEPGAKFLVHMFDDDAANRLKQDSIAPPTDLASFISLFPFRNDTSYSQIDDEVQAKNDSNKEIAKQLADIDTNELQLVAQAKTKNVDSIDNDFTDPTVKTLNETCALMVVGGTTIDSIPKEIKWHQDCLAVLQKPYTEQDWFRDETNTENVKAVQQDAAQTAAEVARYLSEMSISLRFLTEFANNPNSKPKQLDLDELRDLYVINSD